jgi:hypothetical protein
MRRSQTAATRSVDVRRGELKRVLDQLELRFGILSQDHFDDVEPEKDVRIIEHPQPGQRAARDALLLIGPNGFERPAELFAPARFYFDKDECVVVATDDVDLAAAASFEISVEDLVTVLPEKTAGCFLAADSAPQMLRRFVRGREAVAPPARKSGDGSDKARVHEVW